MSLFAYHFTRRLLHEAGWPRKLGMFKGEGYDARVVDAERLFLSIKSLKRLHFSRTRRKRNKAVCADIGTSET